MWVEKRELVDRQLKLTETDPQTPLCCGFVVETANKSQQIYNKFYNRSNSHITNPPMRLDRDKIVWIWNDKVCWSTTTTTPG